MLARVYLYAQKEDEALEQAKEVMNFASKKELSLWQIDFIMEIGSVIPT